MLFGKNSLQTIANEMDILWFYKPLDDTSKLSIGKTTASVWINSLYKKNNVSAVEIFNFPFFEKDNSCEEYKDRDTRDEIS